MGSPKEKPEWTDRFSELQINSRDIRLKKYYSHGMVSDSTPLEAVPMVAMDFETTGLDANKDEIVSIGLVPFNLQRIYCNQSDYWIVKPRGQLTNNSVVIHGITHQDVAPSPDILQVLNEMLEAMEGKVPVVHCRQIERKFLKKMLHRCINEGIEFPVIDTMALEQRALEARRGILGKLLGKPLGSLTLADSRKRYALPMYPQHHALVDATATAELLLAQVSYHYSDNTAVGSLWC